MKSFPARFRRLNADYPPQYETDQPIVSRKKSTAQRYGSAQSDRKVKEGAGSETMQSGASADFIAREVDDADTRPCDDPVFFLSIYPFSGGTVHRIANYS